MVSDFSPGPVTRSRLSCRVTRRPGQVIIRTSTPDIRPCQVRRLSSRSSSGFASKRVLNVLRATPSDSVRMEEEWTAMHRERILKHALKVVRARVSSRVWACFVQRVFQNHPAAEIARDLNMEPNSVYVNACRVMKLVRTVCEEFEEDMSHAFESDLS